MLGEYQKPYLKHKMVDELKVALQTIWEELPQEHIDKTVANFSKRLTACMTAVAMVVTCSKEPFPSLHPHLGSFQNYPHTEENNF